MTNGLFLMYDNGLPSPELDARFLVLSIITIVLFILCCISTVLVDPVISLVIAVLVGCVFVVVARKLVF